MAILHVANLMPSKLELITAWLETQPWGGVGEINVVGTYRFDDPAGEVGVEAFVVRRGELLLHIPLTYRATPLEGGVLVGNTEHSVLGTRWVYDGTSDPVAVGCFARALRGEQTQAEMEIWDGDQLVERRSSALRLSLHSGRTDATGSDQVQIARVLGDPPDGAHQLAVGWDAGEVVVAALD
jgi:hypothetical protein